MSKAIKHWDQFSRMLAFHRLTGAMLAIVAAVSVVTVGCLLNRPPVVVVKECDQREYHRGKRENVPLVKEDVAAFVEKFVQVFYTWEGFDPEKITGALSCMTTDALRAKLIRTLESDPRNKKGTLSQYVGRVRAQLGENVSRARFDRIFTLDGVPVVSRERVELHVIRGDRKGCNPVGLYVNGIKEI